MLFLLPLTVHPLDLLVGKRNDSITAKCLVPFFTDDFESADAIETLMTAPNLALNRFSPLVDIPLANLAPELSSTVKIIVIIDLQFAHHGDEQREQL